MGIDVTCGLPDGREAQGRERMRQGFVHSSVSLVDFGFQEGGNGRKKL